MNGTKEMISRRSASPVLRGSVYCSPWCGLGCKRADYEKRLVQVAELVEILGPEWTPEVWENLGWHGSVSCGPVSVSICTGSYSKYDYSVSLLNIGRSANPMRFTNRKTRIPSLIRECLAEVESDIADSIEKLSPVKAWVNASPLSALERNRP